MDFPSGVMLTIRSVTTTIDPLGDSTTTTVETPWGPCAIAPRTASENADPTRPAVIIGKTVYGPTVTLDADDQILIDGIAYEVDGEAGDWRSPFTGWAPGMEVPVKRASAV